MVGDGVGGVLTKKDFCSWMTPNSAFGFGGVALGELFPASPGNESAANAKMTIRRITKITVPCSIS